MQTFINRAAIPDHVTTDSCWYIKELQLYFSIDASFMCNSHEQNWVLMIANVILLILYSYLALINYSYPLTNEIIGKFCRVSALTPAFYQSWIFVYFRVKGLCKMICVAVNRIFAYYRSLNCSQIIKKQRQECLTSDNNNSTITDLPKKT